MLWRLRWQYSFSLKYSWQDEIGQDFATPVFFISTICLMMNINGQASQKQQYIFNQIYDFCSQRRSGAKKNITCV